MPATGQIKTGRNVSIKKVVFILCFVILIGIAIIARFGYLTDREFFDIDEFVFHEGTTVAPLLQDMFIHFADIIKDPSRFFGFYVMGIFKGIFALCYTLPLYITASMIASSIFGKSASVCFYMNAVFGVLTLIYFFILSKKLFSRRVALISLFFLALSPAHIYYSRLGLGISMAIFFMILSFYAYVCFKTTKKHKYKYMILSGIFMGCSVTCHPGYFVLLGVYFISELHDFIISNNKMLSFKHSLALAVSFFSVIIFWEIPYFIVHTYFALKKEIPFFANYYTSMASINNMHSYVPNFLNCFVCANDVYKIQPKSIFDFFYFFTFLGSFEGFQMCLLFMGVVTFLIIKYLRYKLFQERLLLLWITIPLIFYSTAHMIMQGRHYMMLIPAFYIGLAYMLDTFCASKFRPLCTFLLITISASFIYNSVINTTCMIKSKLTLKPIADYIESHDLDDILVNSTMMWYNAREQAIQSLPGFKSYLKTYDSNKDDYSYSSVGVRSSAHFDDIVFSRSYLIWTDVERLYREGKIRYFITNIHDHFDEIPPKGVFKNARPLVYVDNPYFVFRPGLYGAKSYEGSKKYLSNDSLKYVALYDLKDVFKDN